MKISVLAEDTCKDSRFLCEHGLSLYLETPNQTILFDTGKSGLFAENAVQLGLSLTKVDFAVLSHGHYDHGGGIETFFQVNDHAPFYVHEHALAEHFAQRPSGRIDFIGIEKPNYSSDRWISVHGDLVPAPECLLFSSIEESCLLSRSNDVLKIKKQGSYEKDPFFDEQYLLVEQQTGFLLLTGCAHRGIVNILRRAQQLTGGKVTAVVGGFHLSNPSAGTCEPDDTIAGVARELASYPITYYTCHCTGRAAYEKLKPMLGEQLRWIGAGDQFDI